MSASPVTERAKDIFRNNEVPYHVVLSKPVVNEDKNTTVFGMNADGTYSHRVDFYDNGAAYYTNVKKGLQVYVDPENGVDDARSRLVSAPYHERGQTYSYSLEVAAEREMNPQQRPQQNPHFAHAGSKQKALASAHQEKTQELDYASGMEVENPAPYIKPRKTRSEETKVESSVNVGYASLEEAANRLNASLKSQDVAAISPALLTSKGTGAGKFTPPSLA